MPAEPTVERADLTALIERVRLRDVGAFRRRVEGGGTGAMIGDLFHTVFVIALTTIFGGLAVLALLVVGAGVVLRVLDDADRGFAVIAGTTAIAVTIFAACFALVAWFVRLGADIAIRDGRLPPNWRRRYRLHRFAVDNGLSYVPEAVGLRRSGVIFTAGRSPRGYDILSTGPGSDFEIGNFQYAGDWRSERALRRFGYFRLRLPGPLPHIVLEARRNRRWFGRSNLPWRFTSKQALSLEGDFDRFFRLHVPEGFEQDALYLFTPDLMVLFMDRASDFDVEIVDDWMYVYSPRPFRMADQRTYERLFAVLDTVGRRTLDRSARYTRHQPPSRYRVPSRLIRSIRIGPIVILGVFVLLLVRRLVMGA
ncbi:hypothetical protein ABH923_000870 [Leifsonia sp. EB41]|uniref:hypothetical protein n=1 Tax=Leifsonia sp. EB41 TaxID=3156260 RepID=UPI003516E3E7